MTIKKRISIVAEKISAKNTGAKLFVAVNIRKRAMNLFVATIPIKEKRGCRITFSKSLVKLIKSVYED